MLSKFSVRRPFTVLVAVVLAIVLGIVSFLEMNTDLLPNMEFPYAIVITTYPGASPEEVETTVTKPIEQTMASVSNIKNIMSSSQDNMSMVMLEFNQSANMDSITIEMRESLDTLTSVWDDSISNPIIMKMNPDMMPIMVAAIDYDDMTSTEVTNKAKSEVVPELESIEGVASVTTTGEVEEKVEVVIRQDKIDEMNKKVQDAIDGKLDDAKKKITDGKEKIENGKDTLDTQKEKAASEMAKGKTKLNKASSSVADGLKEINSQITEVKKQQKELLETEKKVNSGLATVQTEKAKLLSTLETLQKTQESLNTLNTTLQTLLTTQSALQAQVDAGTATAEVKEQLATVNAQIAGIDNTLTAQGMTRETLAAKLAEVKAGITSAQSGKAALEQQEASLSETKKKVSEGKKQINSGLAKLNAAKKKLENGETTTTKALEELNKQQVLASIQMSVAEVKLSNGESSLKEAEKSLNETKKTTKSSSDLSTIITTEMVQNVLKAENFEMPAGYITEGDAKYLVKVGEKVESTDQIENLVIADMDLDGLEPIKLSDVADVVRTDNSSEIYTNLNGNPAVAVVMEKQTGYSTGEVTDRVLDEFEDLQKDIDGLHITVLMNQGVYIDLVVNSVGQNLLMGGILAIFILLLFLKDLRPTIIVACSIPLSLVTAVVLMYFSGVTMNIISLSGLALGVGMLVDNSVVVIENIFRLRKEGETARRAAVEGAKEVAGAITASTLTTVCVFAPIVFTDGITRQLFVDLGLTLAYSLLASLLVALTLVPAMSAGMLKKTKEHKEGFINKIQNVYANILSKVLRFKVVVILGSLAVLILAAWWSISRGTAFMPEMESTQMTMTLSTEKEVSFEDTTKMSDEVIKRIRDIEDIQTVGAMSGGGGMMSGMMGGNQGGTSISMYILLNEKRTLSNDELKKKIEEKTKDMKDCKIDIQTSSMDMSALGSSGISIKVKGKDLDKLQKITEDIMKKIETVEGLKEISNGLEDGTEEFRVIVDKSKAMKYSLTVAQVFQQINAKVKEATSATTISTDTKDYDVYVKNDTEESISQADVKDMDIEYTNQQGKKKKVKLSKIATFEKAVSPNAIVRDNQQRLMTVSASLKDDYNIGLVSNDVKKVLKDYEAPDGYTIEMDGEDETIMEAMGQLLLMLLLAIIFMYLIMVAQFQSLLSPFIILFTIPLAFTGGFLGLAITGSEVSVIAMVGFVMLAGVIVNNGIVLVDYINQLRRRGLEKREAIVEAGRTRLRPILMTALTTILGLSTMAMGLGMGGDMVQPMAIVTIGGLLYGTLLTLFVVPCIYDLLNRKKNMVEEEI